MSDATRITNRRMWDSGRGGEEVTIQVDGDSKLTVEMLDYSGLITNTFVLHYDGTNRTEVTIEQGKATIYSD